MPSTPNLDILFEDDAVVVFNKPSGVVVNRSDTTVSGTVQDFLEKHIFSSSGLEGTSEFAQRSGIVHRLDKDTSGVLLAAKTEQAFELLKDQFKTRAVEKKYIALVSGHVHDDKLTVKAPIARNPKNRMSMAVIKKGKFALTEFEVILRDFYEGVYYSVLIVKPLTGRMHQIRVHLAALNHPVLCDPIYMTRKTYEESKTKFGRLMLHSYELKFVHPQSGADTTISAPIPEEMKKLMAKGNVSIS